MSPILTSHCSLDQQKRECLLSSLYSSSPLLTSFSAEEEELSIWLDRPRQSWTPTCEGAKTLHGKEPCSYVYTLFCFLRPEVSCSLFESLSPSFRPVCPLLSACNKLLLRRHPPTILLCDLCLGGRVRQPHPHLGGCLDKWMWGWLHQPRRLSLQTWGCKLKI